VVFARTLAVFGVLLCTPGAAAPGALDPAGSPKTHTVKIEATRFEPAALTVAPGDTVVWVNADMFPHTATSPIGAFDSKEIRPGKSWKYVVPKKGLFEYICSLHPSMKASLRVR
jgi:plastocyanin